MKISDRPGRFFALLIFSPLLLYCGNTIKNDYKNIYMILSILGILLFLYELYWVLKKPSEISYQNNISEIQNSIDLESIDSVNQNLTDDI